MIKLRSLKVIHKLIVLSLFYLFFLVCCTGSKDELQKQIEKWQGKEIIFPENILYAKYAQDSFNYKIPDANFKILLYTDSIGCNDCKMQLNKWKRIINEIDSLTNKSVPFLFFFQPKKNIRHLQHSLRLDKIDFPVYVDIENKLNELNNFSKNSMFQCFLLDKQNKVIGIGNPVYNSKIKEFYISQISGNKCKKQIVATTTAQLVSTQSIELGHFKKSKSQSCEILIKNTGKNALIIKDVDASCGCIRTDYNHNPVKPNDNVIIKVEYTAENAGFFSKSLRIICNTDSPINVLIKGVAD